MFMLTSRKISSMGLSVLGNISRWVYIYYVLAVQYFIHIELVPRPYKYGDTSIVQYQNLCCILNVANASRKRSVQFLWNFKSGCLIEWKICLCIHVQEKSEAYLVFAYGKPFIIEYFKGTVWFIYLVGWLVVLKIYCILALSLYRDLESGDNQSLKL